MPLNVNQWKSTLANDRVEELIAQFRLSRIAEEKSPNTEEGGSSNLDQRAEGNGTSISALKHNALIDSRINKLSGGEYQRVVLARSIAHRPSVVFVDEPTSALNRELAYDALSVMRDLQRNRTQAGITFMITHDEQLAEEFCNVIVRMAPRKNEPAGEVVEVIRNDQAEKESGSVISQRGARWKNTIGKLPQDKERLKEPTVIDQDVLRIPGLGPRKAVVLKEQLQVENLEQLLAVCEAGEVQQLKGFSAKTEQTILAGIAIVQKAAKERSAT
jgi:ABC-type glutathione transport system ATPase component